MSWLYSHSRHSQHQTLSVLMWLIFNNCLHFGPIFKSVLINVSFRCVVSSDFCWFINLIQTCCRCSAKKSKQMMPSVTFVLSRYILVHRMTNRSNIWPILPAKYQPQHMVQCLMSVVSYPLSDTKPCSCYSSNVESSINSEVASKNLD